MTARWWLEAWTIPGASPFERRVLDVPGRFVFEQPASGVGRIQIDVPRVWGRLDDLLDPVNDVGSLLRVMETDDAGDPQIRAEYSTRRSTLPFADYGQVVKVTAPSIEDELESIVVYPYDHPAAPSKTPDHIYGGEQSVGSFTNGGFEDFDLNGGAESGEITPWTDTPQDSIFDTPDVSLVVQTTDVSAGTYAFEVDPGPLHSGMQTRIAVQGGGQYVFTAKLKDPAATGDRYTMYIKMGDGSTLNVGAAVWSGYGIAELAGAAYRAGVSDGTWQTLTATVTFGADVTDTTVIIQYDDHTGGVSSLFRVDEIDVTGPGIGLDPWEAVGLWDTYELDTTKSEAGSNSLKFKVNAASALGGSGVRQKVTGLVIGKTYTWGAWFQHDGAGNEPIRMVAKRPAGTYAAQALFQIPTGVIDWTYASVTFVADTTEIWVDYRYDAAGTSPNLWMDTANIAEGLAAAPVGEILTDLFNDAQVDHILEAGDAARQTATWIKLDFTTLVDAAGNTWRADEALRIVRGKTYGKVLSDLSALGYEYCIRPNPNWPADTESHILQVFNPSNPTTKIGGNSTDLTATVGFSTGNVVSGPVVKTPKSRTVALAEGDGQNFAVSKDAAGVAAWGARELYVGVPGVLEPATLAQAASNALVERGAGIQASKIRIVDADLFAPFIDFTPGDWVKGELPPELPRGDHRIMNVVGTITDGVAVFDLDLGAKVFVGTAGTDEAVRRLLAKFDEFPKSGDGTGGAIDAEGFTGPIEPTFLVASVDARSALRAVADFICDGTNDEDEIQAAFDALPSTGGKVVLSEGRFYPGNDVALVQITMPSGTHLQGCGMNVTQFVSDSVTAAFDFQILYGSDCDLTDFAIVETGGI